MQDATRKRVTFARRLREVREQRGLSQSDVAERTGLLQAAVSHFETGRRTPSLENLIRLVDALNVSADVLLGRSGVDSAQPRGPVAEKLLKAAAGLSERNLRTLITIARDLGKPA